MPLLHLYIAICVFFYNAAAQSGVVTQEFIDAINRQQSYWKAGWNFPKNTTWEELPYKGGADGDDKIKPDLPFKKYPEIVHRILKLPKNFDARTKWPRCKAVIERVRNQGKCGSCWAVSGASTMSDRTCIDTNGSVIFHYSSEDVATCCPHCASYDKKKNDYNPCLSGFGWRAWGQWTKVGFVSGGETGSKEGCKPYSPEMKNKGEAPACKTRCTNPSYNVSYHKDLHRGKEAYQVGNSVKDIQTDIYKNGPIQVRFGVYEDFYTYKSGVYVHQNGSLEFYHLVKIIGWGEEDGLPYWLGVNSWGRKWGLLGGFFKFLKGKNHCEIEDYTFAGKYKTRSSPSRRTKSCSCQKLPSYYLFAFIIFYYIYPYLI